MAMSPRILLLDDDVALLDFLRFTITRHFPTAHVIPCTNGYTFLTAYQQHGADVLILDHRLPDVLGSALLQYLRETGVTTPAILLSGMLAREAVPPEARTFFLPKPLRLDVLVTTITTALDSTYGSVLAA